MPLARAAVCHSLSRRSGKRTEGDKSLTEIQEFCKDQQISGPFFSYVTATYRFFAVENLNPGLSFLITQSRLEFTHFRVAVALADKPGRAVEEAHDKNWSDRRSCGLA